MILKILGVALLVLCGGAVGFGRLAALRRHIGLLAAIDNSLDMMEAEIALCGRPLPEIFELLALRGARETRGFYSSLAEKCGYMSAAEAWVECSSQLELPDEALRAILSLAAVLGAYDGERQSGSIAALRRALSLTANSLKAELGSRAKNYPALGACLAGIVAMLMI